MTAHNTLIIVLARTNTLKPEKHCNWTNFFLKIIQSTFSFHFELNAAEQKPISKKLSKVQAKPCQTHTQTKKYLALVPKDSTASFWRTIPYRGNLFFFFLHWLTAAQQWEVGCVRAPFHRHRVLCWDHCVYSAIENNEIVTTKLTHNEQATLQQIYHNCCTRHTTQAQTKIKKATH